MLKKQFSTIKLVAVFMIMTFLLFVSTDNLILTAAFFVITVAYTFVYAMKRFKQLEEYKVRVEHCNIFINSMVVNLTIKTNLKECIDTVIHGLPAELKKEVEFYQNDDPEVFVTNLRDYFKVEIYDVFSETITLYNQQGGDPLTLFSEILENSRSALDKVREKDTEGKKTFVTTSILWGLALSILVVCRFAIGEIYLELMKDLFFGIMVFCAYLVALACYHLYILKLTSAKGSNNEKYR